MKTRRQLFAAALVVAVALAIVPTLLSVASAQAQQYGAIERGYRTGYSDGFQSGWSDQLRRAGADYRSKQDYQRADRAYINAYGSLEDYRDGYQQGFEVGYDAGYNRRGFDSEIPSGGITRRGATPRETAESNSNGRGGITTDGTNESSSQTRGTDSGQVGGGRSAPSDIFLLVELQNRLTTDVSQRGDPLEAEVIEPQEYAGATVRGRLDDVKRPGKATGTALLQISFDQIRMPGGEWQDFSAQVVEVIQPSPETNVDEVDPEGGIRGKSTTKEDAIKVGAGAGIGAIIGGIAGGGKGAGIGAIIGGAAGTASAVTQRGKEIRLERGQQLRIRTASRPR
ncbi:MAG TPA: hypothetical protein VEX60_07710 [Pyrinomonadaceae bacterium]|nr:hypothetical protein [Pyrinomonadaceae bacterium]